MVSFRPAVERLLRVPHFPNVGASIHISMCIINDQERTWTAAPSYPTPPRLASDARP
jgi:hypothetical protein